MKPAEQKQLNQINPLHVKIVKALFQNLKNGETNKQLFERALAHFDKDAMSAIRMIRTDEAAKNLFDQHFLEFNCWNQSFLKAAQQKGRKEQLKNFDIVGKLLSLQPKIKHNNPHSSYLTYLMMMLSKEKDLKLDRQFMETWKDHKNILKEQKNKVYKEKQEKQERDRLQKLQQQQRLSDQAPNQQTTEIKEKPSQVKPASTAVEVSTKAQQQEKQSDQPEKQRQKLQKQLKLDAEKKQAQKMKQIQKYKAANEAKFKKNKENRLSNMMKYLESRKQFTFGSNKETVAKEILSSMEKFMKQKLQKILKCSKMRLRGYVGEDAGDEFRMYSNKSTLMKPKGNVVLPETNDIKILKVKYPSKLESYLRLRIEEERQQQRLKNQLRQRIESDKKSDKIIQSYIIADTQDQKQIIHEFQRDDGPQRKQRLTITKPVIQYVIQMDPWFKDLFMMERTFYRGPS